MGDPYWRYGGGGSARPSSSERGNIPKTAFPGYLSSETSTLPNYNSYNSIDRQTSSSDLFHKDILPSRSGAYGIDSLPSVRAEPSISGLVSGASYKDYTSSFEDPNQLVHGREAALGQTPGIPDILPSHSGAYGIGGMSSVRAEPSVSGLVAGSSYKGYSFSFEDPNLPVHHRDVALGRTLGIPDILPSHAGAYGIDGMPSVRDEPIISGLVAGASYKGYPSSSDASNQLVHGRDVASGRTPGIPDLGYDRPNSMSRTDGNPAPVAESNVLFIDGLPTDCTRREIGHLFRPFLGFRDVRVIHKERRRRGDKASVLCFVEFTDTKCAGTAMEALQGYKFDHKKPDSPILRIHFAHFPFRLPSDQKHPQLGHSR